MRHDKDDATHTNDQHGSEAQGNKDFQATGLHAA